MLKQPKLKGSIHIFGSFYKKVNTTPQEISLYKKVGYSKAGETVIHGEQIISSSVYCLLDFIFHNQRKVD